MTRSIEACVLCGAETGDRVMAIVEWSEPIGRETWSHVPRCVDRAACRATVEVVLGVHGQGGAPGPEGNWRTCQLVRRIPGATRKPVANPVPEPSGAQPPGMGRGM